MSEIFLLFPLYDGGTYDYSYMIEDVTTHETFEAAKQFAADAHKLQSDVEYDGYPDELWGFQIVIPTPIKPVQS